MTSTWRVEKISAALSMFWLQEIQGTLVRQGWKNRNLTFGIVRDTGIPGKESQGT